MGLRFRKCTFIGYTSTTCIIYDQVDPVLINEDISSAISAHLQNAGDLVVRSYQSNITLSNLIEWDTPSKLTFITRENIVFTPTAFISMSGVLELKPGIESTDGNGTVVFEGESMQIDGKEHSKVMIHYNPVAQDEVDESPKWRGPHKYYNPKNLEQYESRVKSNNLKTYKLINNLDDLTNIDYNLSVNYALSQDIISTPKAVIRAMHLWDFRPSHLNPFLGELNGNNYKIQGLKVIGDINAGLFVKCSKSARIFDLTVEDFEIEGWIRAGTLCGVMEGAANIRNVTVLNSKIIIDGTKRGAGIGPITGGKALRSNAEGSLAYPIEGEVKIVNVILDRGASSNVEVVGIAPISNEVDEEL